jgi:hypothetical protein
MANQSVSGAASSQAATMPESSPTRVQVQIIVAPDGGFGVRHGDVTVIDFPDSGTRARIDDQAARYLPISEILRLCAPFALAQRGLVLLHAGCAMRDGNALCFIAPGGTGKSTIAAALQQEGWQCVSDDALLCDPDGYVDVRAEVLLRSWCRELAPTVARTGQVDFESLAAELIALRARLHDDDPVARLCGIIFLRLPRTNDGQFSGEILSPVNGFHELAQQSFGAAPGSAAWAHEARVYQGLANTIPLWSVRVPQGLEAMQQALPGWLGSLASRGSSDFAGDPTACLTAG